MLQHRKQAQENNSMQTIAYGTHYLIATVASIGLMTLLWLTFGAGSSIGAAMPAEIQSDFKAVAGTGSQLGDRVWLDANRNGLQDAGEVGMAGVIVTLHRSGTGMISNTQTDATGIYTFTDVITGTYALEFSRPAGYVFSPLNVGNDDAMDSDPDPGTGFTPYFDVAEGNVDTTLDAGLMERIAPGTFYLPVASRTLFLPVLENGGFELQRQGWAFLNRGLPASIVSQANDPSVPRGTYSALLGRADYPCSATGVPRGYAAVEQGYTVPNSSRSIAMRFKYIIWSQDASTSAQYDRFEVFVTPQNGNPDLLYFDGNMVNQGLGCGVWHRVPGPQNPRNGQIAGWAEASIDLNAYRGQTVTFSFRNYSRYDGWYNTYTYLDDVRVEFGD